MSKINDILEFNQAFVKIEEYRRYQSSKYPDKKIAVLSCMDARLTELLPAALGLRNGDAKIIKNAGAMISHPYGSVMRSLMVCVYELGVEDIIVVGHHDCGMENLDPHEITRKMLNEGIDPRELEKVKTQINFDKWLCGFSDTEIAVRETVKIIQNHPLIPFRISVHGMVMSPETGAVDLLV